MVEVAAGLFGGLGGVGGLWVVGGEGGGSAGDGFAEEVFNEFEFAAFARGDERHGDAAFAGAGGASDAVDIVFSIVGHVVVDHHRDVVNVDSAGHYVGCHKDVDVAGAEVAHNLFADRLVEVGVHFAGLDFESAEGAGEFLDLDFR